MEYVLLALAVLAIPFMGVAAFVMVLNLKRRTLVLEERVMQLEGRAFAVPAAQAAPSVALETPREEASIEAVSPVETPQPAPEEIPATPQPEPVPEQEPVAEGFDQAATPPASALPPAAAAAGTLEDRLGSRWAVWVGGLALALGAVLMVRYSIEQGYFGPAARIVFAALFSAALIGAGEWFRRHEPESPIPGLASAYVPGVLTAAGTIAAFATVYGAYALYGFVGPAAAFILLGAIAVATMVASALHGPALAGLGLVGALATPLLVSTTDPKPWPLVLYLTFVVAAAYALARTRLWRWLALAGAVGAGLWGLLLILTAGSSALGAIAAYVAVQTVLAGLFLVAEPHRDTPDEAARLDFFALPILAGLAVLGVMAADLNANGSGRAVIAGGLALLHLGLALRFAAVSPGALIAAGMGAATLALWPVAHLVAGEPSAVLPSTAGEVPAPQALETYLAFAIGLGLLILGGAFWRLRRGAALALTTAAPYAAALTSGPMLLLVVSYWRVTDFDTSVPFAAAAGVLALLFVGAANVLRREEGASPALHLGVGATASAAVGALALGLTFALSQGTLTVSFALSALATAWIAVRVDVPALRYAVGALGFVVLGRLIWDPVLVGDRLGATPIFNWLLWGYGVPALSFGLAGRMLAATRRDQVVSLCETLAILFSAALVYFEIRHAFHGGDPFAPEWGLAEVGLIVSAALAFAIVLVRLDRTGRDPVRRIGALAFAVVAVAIAASELLFSVNPLIEGQTVEGGAILNTLIPGYLLPAAMAFALAYALRHIWAGRIALYLGLVLQFIYTIAQVRRLFQGPDIMLTHSTGEAELWAYSAVLLVIGVAALAIGLVRDVRGARILSAVYVIAAVLKVFLIDLSNLEGMLRALSFIGLGLVLVGIGLAYQKLLVRRAPPPAGSGNQGPGGQGSQERGPQDRGPQDQGPGPQEPDPPAGEAKLA